MIMDQGLCSHTDVEGAVVGKGHRGTEEKGGKVFEQAHKCSSDLSTKKLSDQKWRKHIYWSST